MSQSLASLTTEATSPHKHPSPYPNRQPHLEQYQWTRRHKTGPLTPCGNLSDKRCPRNPPVTSEEPQEANATARSQVSKNPAATETKSMRGTQTVIHVPPQPLPTIATATTPPPMPRQVTTGNGPYSNPQRQPGPTSTPTPTPSPMVNMILHKMHVFPHMMQPMRSNT